VEISEVIHYPSLLRRYLHV